MEDKYELKCQSTDNDATFNEKKGQVLVPKKTKTENPYTFNDFSESLIFQIIMVLIIVFLFYFLLRYIISKIGQQPTIMNGGGKRKFKLF